MGVMRDVAVRVKGGMLGGAGLVVLLRAAQVRPSARLDALFATAAHLTGLLAGYGILVLLFLMARVPAVEHGVGGDRLARRHALGGRHVLLLCFGHGLLALLGYAVHEGVDVLSAGRGLLGYPALAAAAAGTGLLAAVGVTSARALRRRLAHETWRGVHPVVYLAAALAFGHQLAGPDLAVAAWSWALGHALVGVLLVWYRAVVPLREALRHAPRVAEVRAEGPGVVSVVVHGRDLAELRAEPGQFLRWRSLWRGLWYRAGPRTSRAAARGGAGAGRRTGRDRADGMGGTCCSGGPGPGAGRAKLNLCASFPGLMEHASNLSLGSGPCLTYQSP